jgi:glutamyl-Q tRNA(Asp) synthetase
MLLSPTNPPRGSEFLPLHPDGRPAVTRFAPSPTGYMHLGHAYAALFAWHTAERSGGRLRLRIEDIDVSRCRPVFEDAIYEDLAWLGVAWDGPVRRQSDHMGDYGAALEELGRLGVLYPCFCTRKAVRAEIERAEAAPHGPPGLGDLYPGTCRRLDRREQNARLRRGEAHVLRLDVAEAAALAGPLVWRDLRRGQIEADPLSCGDAILARKDVRTSYHLACTLDDHLQGVTLVTRGEDLFHATHLHVLLQRLLGLRTPDYYHHNLIADTNGQRLAKRNRAVSLRSLRSSGKRPEEIRREVGF